MSRQVSLVDKSLYAVLLRGNAWRCAKLQIASCCIFTASRRTQYTIVSRSVCRRRYRYLRAGRDEDERISGWGSTCVETFASSARCLQICDASRGESEGANSFVVLLWISELMADVAEVNDIEMVQLAINRWCVWMLNLSSQWKNRMRKSPRMRYSSCMVVTTRNSVKRWLEVSVHILMFDLLQPCVSSIRGHIERPLIGWLRSFTFLKFLKKR